MNFLLSDEVSWNCDYDLDRNDEFDLDGSMDHGMSQLAELPVEPEFSVEELPDTALPKDKTAVEQSLD
jgi:hypothetical protein